MILNDTVKHLNPTNDMSSNLRILKICDYCKNEFIAKKITSRSCSHDCARKLHRQEHTISKVELEQLRTEIKGQPKAFITEDEIKAIQAKDYLNLKEAALLLNISSLALRRWLLCGKMKSHKVGKKWMFNRNNLY